MRADRTADLRAEVAGVVVEVVGDIEAGSVVRAQDSLIRLDDRQYEYEQSRALAEAAAAHARVEQLETSARNLERLRSIAQRELRIAEDEVSRLRGLIESDQAVKKELDVAKLAYERARRLLQGFENELALIAPTRAQVEASRRASEATAELARLNMERCVIKAPFDGAVEAVPVELGERVSIGTALVTLVDASHVEIAIRLPVSVRTRVFAGASCRVDIESAGDFSWTGTVDRIDPVADSDTRTFAVYVDVDNSDFECPLMPGSFVRGEIAGRAIADALIVPRGAIHGDSVFVLEGDVARQRSVMVERPLGERAVVRGDLRGGDLLILSNLDQLSDGAAVRASAEEPGTSADLVSSGSGETP